jgi:hypothetical protein
VGAEPDPGAEPVRAEPEALAPQEAGRAARPNPSLGPPGNDTFLVLGRYTSHEALERLLDPDHNERDSVLAIALGVGVLPDNVEVWFATGDYDVIVRLGNASPRTALAFALAITADGISTKTLALYGDLQRVGSEAADARTQRGESARTQRGGDGMG